MFYLINLQLVVFTKFLNICKYILRVRLYWEILLKIHCVVHWLHWGDYYCFYIKLLYAKFSHVFFEHRHTPGLKILYGYSPQTSHGTFFVCITRMCRKYIKKSVKSVCGYLIKMNNKMYFAVLVWASTY